jgi:hypothetical protein
MQQVSSSSAGLVWTPFNLPIGDKTCTVLSVALVQNMKEAKAWKKRMMEEMPWVSRN